MFPADVDTPDAHDRVALNSNPSARLLERAIPEAQMAISHLCEPPPGARRCASTCRAFSPPWDFCPSRSAPPAAGVFAHPGTPAEGLKFPPTLFHTTHFAYDDAEFAHDVSVGMPIAGDVPASGVLRPRPRSSVITLEQWRPALPERNRKLAEGVLSAYGSKMEDACRAHSFAEVGRGRPETPTPATPALMNVVALTPRYAIGDTHEGRAAKVSGVDTLRAAGVNDAMSPMGANAPWNSDVPHATLA